MCSSFVCHAVFTGEAREVGSPIIRTARQRYDVGDELNVNCSGGGDVAQIVQLQWYVNDKEARQDVLRKYNNASPNGGNLLGLRFRLQPVHFPNDELKLKCVATTMKEVSQSSDAFAYEASQYVSGLHLTSGAAGSPSACYRTPGLHSTFCKFPIR